MHLGKYQIRDVLLDCGRLIDQTPMLEQNTAGASWCTKDAHGVQLVTPDAGWVLRDARLCSIAARVSKYGACLNEAGDQIVAFLPKKVALMACHH